MKFSKYINEGFTYEDKPDEDDKNVEWYGNTVYIKKTNDDFAVFIKDGNRFRLQVTEKNYKDANSLAKLYSGKNPKVARKIWG